MSNNETKKPTMEVEPKEFNPIVERKLINSRELCEEVCKLFKAISSEFTGCDLRAEQGPHGTRYALLAYFTPGNQVTGKFQVVRDTISAIDNDNKAMNTLTKIGVVQTARRYDLTDNAKAVFEDMMFVNAKNKIDWKADVTEIADSTIPAGMGGIRNNVARVMVRFDMYKLLAKIYGSESKTGTRYEYNIMVTGEMSGFNQQLGAAGLVNPTVAGPRNLVLIVDRLNTSETRKKAASWGVGNQRAEFSTIPMYTGE